MCSILAILEIEDDAAALRGTALRMSRLQRHRGPDWSGIHQADRAILVHERLSIVDVTHGAQPLVTPDRTVALAVNGEIYNHRDLRCSLQSPYSFQTESDCEVILALYQQRGSSFLDELNGIFAFVLYDSVRDRYLIARDHIGIVPLYTGRDAEERLWVASEMKALVPVCRTIEEFPPGHLLDSSEGTLRRYYTRSWRGFDQVSGGNGDSSALLRDALEQAVHRQLMTDVPYGVLLSGGLDSSVIAACVRKYADRRVEDDDRSLAWWPRLHTFSIGLEGSPDLAAARTVAAHLDIVHHEFHFTLQEGIDALPEVIHHLETYDVTTVRAGTPMYLMARRIRAMGIKMVLSGEGADEIFGGYLYFHRAPDARAFHEETVRKLDRLHLFDCLRANKAMAAWGVEARVPFLDKSFLDVAMAIDPASKMPGTGRMEKDILRRAFRGTLPDSVLWRQKEQFSDGVGYGWIDGLKAFAETQVSESDLASASERFPMNTPVTSEQVLYRRLFEEHFPLEACAAAVPGGRSVACSTPEALEWEAAWLARADPSGRAAGGVHQRAY
ncbi:MAG TPA: asparagine synthase B [Thermoanaerobaculia bacterium]|nr:asparagine synthase B [Thermoanaerobaculia bacterium]